MCFERWRRDIKDERRDQRLCVLVGGRPEVEKESDGKRKRDMRRMEEKEERLRRRKGGEEVGGVYRKITVIGLGRR